MLKNARKKRKSQKKREDEEEASYELSRYIPKLKRVTESLLRNELLSAQFPYVDPPAQEGIQESAGSSSKAKWGKGKEKESVAKFTKGRVVVFVIGGATFSETRSVYELTETYQREVILGSTNIVIPSEFVKSLKSII